MSHRHRHPIGVLLGLGAILLAHREAATQQVVPRDSAGIRILEVPASLLARLPQWTVQGPDVAIGEAMGDPHYEFNLASNPWRLSDGRIVIANNRVELRFYDVRGRYLTTVGRRGQGPGEYQHLSLQRGPGDSLRVLDWPTGRLDVRDPHGKLIRSMRLPRYTVPQWIVGGVALHSYSSRPDFSHLGLQKGFLVIRRMTSNGQAGDTVAIVPGGWSEVLSEGAWRGVRLSGDASLNAGVGGAAFLDGDVLGLYWFAKDGRLDAISRVDLPKVRVTSADVRADQQALSAERARYPQVRVEAGARPPAYARVPAAGRPGSHRR